MKFCMQCGAELSEEAKFCRSCGAKVNSAKTLGDVKAPDTEGDIKVPDTEGDIKVPDTEVNVKAPDTDGEFVLASWDAPAPRDTAVRHEEKPKKEVEPRAKEEPQAKEESPAKEKKQGCLSYLFLYAKVIFIAVGLVFLLVFFIGFFSDDKPDSPKTEQHQPLNVEPEVSTDDATRIPKGDDPVMPKAEVLENSEDDLTVEERIAYLEALLQRSEDQLEEELAKGDNADMKIVKENHEGIIRIREDLRKLKRNK